MIPEILNIDELKQGYMNNEYTPYEVCEEIVNRYNKYIDMNIWITPPDMRFIRPYIDKIMDKDKSEYKLWGIPFAIKDNIDLENIETTAGCKSYAYMPDKNAFVVQRLIDEGAIPVGKTNLDQFATGLVGTRSLYGEVKNSIRPELISGGSSSGSAVAVAMGEASFALGTDTAGSGRVPAALNNLVGFKPSLGSWSTAGVVPACASLDCVTVFTHTLEEAELIDEVARKYDEDCEWSKMTDTSAGHTLKKICIPENKLVFYGPYKNEYESAWNSAVKKIEETGIVVEKIDYSVFSEAASILYDGPWIAERWSSLGDFVTANKGKSMVEVTEKILLSGNREDLRADSVFKAFHRLAEIKCEVKKILKDAVLLMPTAGGTYTREAVDADPISTNSNMGLYTNHCNLLNLCALAFQSGFAADAIPFGLTAFALSGNEKINIELAKKYREL